MKSILLLYKELNKKYKALDNFVDYLDKNPEYYSINREILYTGIINRCYTLWETFNKNIVYEYYIKVKEDLAKSGELISKLRLYELPAYIVESGKYNDQNDTIYYDLNETLITYTSKNMDINQLASLYDRLGVDIVNKLSVNKNILLFISSHGNSFSLEEGGSELLKKALKAIILERNQTAHYSEIVSFKSLDFIKDWIGLYLVIITEITKEICMEVAKNENRVDKNIGEYKGYLSRKKVICLDLNGNVLLDKKSVIGIVNDGKLVNILQPVCFMINDKKKVKAEDYDKVGIEVQSYFNDSISVKKKSGIYLLS